MRPPAVTVVVPVYEGAATVAETLDGILSQRFTRFRVVVTVDRGTDDSEQVCRRFTQDRRVEMVVQPERLGWVGNTNAGIRAVRTESFCIVPHDDLLDADYLGTVHEALALDQDIACAYTDIQGFGAQSPHIWQPGVTGEPHARALDVLLHHFASVAFRGLVRRRHDTDFPLLPTGIEGDFAADTAWLMTLALRGTLHRVPATLYRKRYAPTTVHAGWSRWPQDVQQSRYLSLVATMTTLALQGLEESRHDIVAAAGLLRATGLTRTEDDYGTPWRSLERVRAAQAFGALLAAQAGSAASRAFRRALVSSVVSGLIDAEVGATALSPRASALRVIRHARGNLLLRLATSAAERRTSPAG